MSCKYILASASVVTLLLAYYVYEPIPEGFSKPLQLRCLLAFLRLTSLPVKILSSLGLGDEFSLSRTMFGVIQATPEGNRSTEHLQIYERSFDGVEVRMYVPQNQPLALPALVFLHGGGWTIGNPFAYDEPMEYLTQHLNIVIASVDYRLAPEHPHPAPLDDCVTAYMYLVLHAQEFNVDVSRIVVMGDSAGGHLATTLAFRLRDEGFHSQPKLQVLIYPMIQPFNFKSPSYVSNSNGPCLHRKAIPTLWGNFLFGNQQYYNEMLEGSHVTSKIRSTLDEMYMNIAKLPEDLTKDYEQPVLKEGNPKIWEAIQNKLFDPYAVPLVAKDLRNLPKAFVITCNYDVLRDEGIWYAQRLQQAGNDVIHKTYTKGFHSVFSFFQLFEEGMEIMKDIEHFLQQNL